jgi:hypothetical protein
MVLFDLIGAHKQFNNSIYAMLNEAFHGDKDIRYEIQFEYLQTGWLVLKNDTLFLNLQMYHFIYLSILSFFGGKKCYIVHHNTAYSIKDRFAKRLAKKFCFSIGRGCHIFLSKNIDEYHKSKFRIESFYCPHPLPNYDVNASKKKCLAFIAGNINKDVSPYFIKQKNTELLFISNRTPESFGYQRHIEYRRIKNYDYFISRVSLLVCDHDLTINRVSGIVYDILTVGGCIVHNDLQEWKVLKKYFPNQLFLEFSEVGAISATEAKLNVENYRKYVQEKWVRVIRDIKNT